MSGQKRFEEGLERIKREIRDTIEPYVYAIDFAVERAFEFLDEIEGRAQQIVYNQIPRMQRVQERKAYVDEQVTFRGYENLHNIGSILIPSPIVIAQMQSQEDLLEESQIFFGARLGLVERKYITGVVTPTHIGFGCAALDSIGIYSGVFTGEKYEGTVTKWGNDLVTGYFQLEKVPKEI